MTPNELNDALDAMELAAAGNPDLMPGLITVESGHWMNVLSEVRAVCDRCCTYMWMDPKTIIAVSGTDTFFWGRQGTCKIMYGLRRCTGKTWFEAKTPRADCWYSLNEHVQTARHLFKIRRP